MKSETERIHPVVELVAENVRSAYKTLQQSKTSEAKKAARKNVLEELLVASIITQYTERANSTKP